MRPIQPVVPFPIYILVACEAEPNDRQRILESADDLGEPGTDPYDGNGRINIARVLGVLR